MAGIVYDFGGEEEVTVGVVYDFGASPNEELEMRKTAVARKALEQDPASAATDVPSLPNPSVPDTVSPHCC